MTFQDLVPGDWFVLEIGFTRCAVYVVSNQPDASSLTFCSTRWLYSSAWTWDYKHIQQSDPVYIGRGKWKWWLFWTPDLIAPYNKPRNAGPPQPITTKEEWPEYVIGM